MYAIEVLEDRIAPAAGLTVSHLSGGALAVVGTDGDDGIYLRSDEPGWLTIGVTTGDLIVDGMTSSGQAATMPMPKGPISIKLLGGVDGLFLGSFSTLNPDATTGGSMIIPGSLDVTDTTGNSLIAMNNLVVRGNLGISGSSDSDTVIMEGRVAVGHNFTAELGSGVTDLLRNRFGAADISVGGSFTFHSTASNAAVALGLNLDGQFDRPIDNDPNIAEEPDVPLALRQFKVVGSMRFEAASSDARLFLGGAALRVGGKLSVLATEADSSLTFRAVSSGALALPLGVVITTGDSSAVTLEGQQVAIGASISLTGGAGNDTFSVYGGTVMRLPKTTLNFSAGNTDTYIAGEDPWFIGGALTVTADSGADFLGLRGPGKVASTLSAAFGGGSAGVLIGGDGAGRFNLVGPAKLSSSTQIDVAIFNSVLMQRLDVGGSGVAGPAGNDSLSFDSVRAMKAVVFNGGAGSDGFYVDDRTDGGYTPSSFLGPVVIDFGDGADGATLGNPTNTGKATFFAPVTFKGLSGETYSAQTEFPANIVFKVKPTFT